MEKERWYFKDFGDGKWKMDKVENSSDTTIKEKRVTAWIYVYDKADYNGIVVWPPMGPCENFRKMKVRRATTEEVKQLRLRKDAVSGLALTGMTDLYLR